MLLTSIYIFNIYFNMIYDEYNRMLIKLKYNFVFTCNYQNQYLENNFSTVQKIYHF